MGSLKQLRYYRGILLPAICVLMDIPKDRQDEACDLLHEAFKEYLGIGSILGLSIHKTEVVYNRIRMLMARERGMLLPLPRDPPVRILEVMPMEMFLKLYKKKDERGEAEKEIRDFVCAMLGVQPLSGKLEQE